jgi:hypothetical protein
MPTLRKSMRKASQRDNGCNVAKISGTVVLERHSGLASTLQ